MANGISVEVIANKILKIRGKKVMLDKDLAELYGVRTKNLNKAVKRNVERFPADFMFQLTKEEVISLRFQFGTSKRGGRRYLPYAFTQEGVAMLSSVLNSERAIKVNIQIMRAFVRLRHILSAHKEFEKKLRELEEKLEKHDVDIHDIFEAIRLLMGLPQAKKVIKGFAQR
jgi:phage regulator Rha-like protein